MAQPEYMHTFCTCTSHVQGANLCISFAGFAACELWPPDGAFLKLGQLAGHYHSGITGLLNKHLLRTAAVCGRQKNDSLQAWGSECEMLCQTVREKFLFLHRGRLVWPKIAIAQDLGQPHGIFNRMA